MSYTLLVGVDWADQCHDVCVLDAAGHRLVEREVQHSGADLAAFADELARLAVANSLVAVAIERPHGPVVETLLQRGFHVFHINPKQLDRFRDRHRLSGAKSDRLDAFVLADALRNDGQLFRRVQLENPLTIELRELSRLDSTLDEQLRALASRLRDQLVRYYPQLLAVIGSACNRPWHWGLWELAPTPAAAHNVSEADVDSFLGRHRVRKHEAQQVLSTLRETPLCVAPGVVEAAVAHIGVLLAQLRLLYQQRQAIGKRLQELMDALAAHQQQRDVAIIRSLPGVGVRVGAALLAEVHQALAERDYQGLRRYTGVAPVTVQSGRRRGKEGGREPRQRTIMRRACSARLRDAAYHWARCSTQTDPRAKDHYRRLRAKGHGHARALRTIADRNLRMLTAMLKTQTLYDPARRGDKAKG